MAVIGKLQGKIPLYDEQKTKVERALVLLEQSLEKDMEQSIDFTPMFLDTAMNKYFSVIDEIREIEKSSEWPDMASSHLLNIGGHDGESYVWHQLLALLYYTAGHVLLNFLQEKLDYYDIKYQKDDLEVLFYTNDRNPPLLKAFIDSLLLYSTLQKENRDIFSCHRFFLLCRNVKEMDINYPWYHDDTILHYILSIATLEKNTTVNSTATDRITSYISTQSKLQRLS